MNVRFLALALLATSALACSSASSSSEPDAATSDVAPASDVALGDIIHDTWTNYAEGFFKKYCVSCHNGTTEPQNFNDYTQVDALKATIRCGVAPVLQSGCSNSPYPPNQFPIGMGPKPTAAERDRLVAWINAGAPEN
jgi:hypothetical protein